MCLAVPGKVAEIFQEDGVRMCRMDFGGVFRNVCLVYLPDISVGQYAIVHAGFAISAVDEATAQQTLQLFDEIDSLHAAAESAGDNETE